MLVGRDELVRKVLYYVHYQRSLFIKAGPGSGKTALLTRLKSLIHDSAYSAASTKKDILTSVALALKLPVKGRRVFELYGDVTFELEVSDCVLLLDDVHELTKSVKALISKLLNHGLILVCAGSSNVFKLPEARMPSLSGEDVERMIHSRLDFPDPLLAKLIKNECSTPQEVSLTLRRARSHDLSSRDKIHKFIDSLQIRRRELLPVWSIISLASFLLAMRYIFYLTREFQMGYTAGAIGYILLSIYRAGRYRR